jgi:hypothetical protein
MSYIKYGCEIEYTESLFQHQSIVKLPRTYHGGAKGERYSSYSFLSTALHGGEWIVSRPDRDLPPVPIRQEAGWASRAGLDTEVRGKNPLSLPGIEPRSSSL